MLDIADEKLVINVKSSSAMHAQTEVIGARLSWSKDTFSLSVPNLFEIRMIIVEEEDVGVGQYPFLKWGSLHVCRRIIEEAQLETGFPVHGELFAKFRQHLKSICALCKIHTALRERSNTV